METNCNMDTHWVKEYAGLITNQKHCMYLQASYKILVKTSFVIQCHAPKNAPMNIWSKNVWDENIMYIILLIKQINYEITMYFYFSSRKFEAGCKYLQLEIWCRRIANFEPRQANIGRHYPTINKQTNNKLLYSQNWQWFICQHGRVCLWPPKHSKLGRENSRPAWTT